MSELLAFDLSSGTAMRRMPMQPVHCLMPGTSTASEMESAQSLARP
jgi:hypothetical protein